MTPRNTSGDRSILDAPHTYKLAPSDLTFLWDDCRLCFRNKVRDGVARPNTPFPKFFNVLDKKEKEFFAGKRTEQVDTALPPGTFDLSDHWVTSKQFRAPGFNASFFVKGKFDVIADFDDGSYGIIDYKTTSPKDDFIPFYSRQLHAYALALEYPAENSLQRTPVTTIGIMAVDPVEMVDLGNGAAFRVETKWIPIAKDYTVFKTFLAEVFSVLEAEVPPMADPRCSFCQYREVALQEGLA